MFSVYIVAAKFVLAICSVYSLLCFVFPLLMIIFETLIFKPLFLYQCWTDLYLIMKKRKIYISHFLPASSPHFTFLLLFVLLRFITYIELSSGNVMTHSVVTNSPFIHDFPVHNMTSNIFYLSLGWLDFVIVSFFKEGLISAMLSDSLHY